MIRAAVIAAVLAQGCASGEGTDTMEMAMGQAQTEPMSVSAEMATMGTPPPPRPGSGTPTPIAAPVPGQATPETMAPGAMGPDTMTPETTAPEAMVPEAMGPEAGDPEAGGPEAGDPAGDPEAGDPETSTTPDTTSPPATGDGPQPTIPAIDGDCPEFRDGSTISVGGHGGVLIMSGTGSGGPLLFYWHGTGSSAGEARRTLPASVRSDITGSGGIIASFSGRQQARGGRDCSGTGAHNMADFDAADQIAACAVANHGIDPRRIYATGCSAGGLQTGCMAAQRGSYIAAVTPNSGGFNFRQSLSEGATPNAFTMHGGSGDNVIVNFGQTSASFGNVIKGAGGFWIDCNHRSGHCRAPADLQAAGWEFLKAHPYGTKTSPYADGLPASFPSYCEIK